MYGDIGHGTLLTLAAYSLIHFEAPLLEKQKKGQLNEILGMAFGGRYIIFMMGLFATYCGMVYNDCLSIPLNVYGSSWTLKEGSGVVSKSNDRFSLRIAQLASVYLFRSP
jgi:V-type H+-transporting ATPase subunit a